MILVLGHCLLVALQLAVALGIQLEGPVFYQAPVTSSQRMELEEVESRCSKLEDVDAHCIISNSLGKSASARQPF